MVTASSGYFPLADSPDSITASVPSRDGVRHVAGFSAGRTRVFDHRIQHLRCGDNHFTRADTFFDNHLLGEDNFFNRDFNAHVATSNHDAVRRFENLVEVVQAFLVFNFGYDLDVFAAVSFQVLADFDDVRTLTDKGSSNEINALFATEDQVLLIFFSQRRQGNRNARQVYAFVFAEVAVVQHFTDDVLTFNGSHFHADQTIVDQNGVTDGQVGSETFIGHGDDFVVANDGFIGSEGECLTCFQGDVIAAFQLDGTNFRAFGVQQDSRCLTGFAQHVTQVLDALTVFSIVTVREVQTHDVHARVQHFGQHLFGFGFRTDGANNFGLFHESFSL
ncbi:Uncharacterised protein [Raoultella planticola]|uniref:Uncharacterized protein n=1 Tax=Raoultella planticola TaxID=575 RepID=A0A485AFB8_RAOPL|nr:Uncharacterised protein [Raoultella planticola]